MQKKSEEHEIQQSSAGQHISLESAIPWSSPSTITVPKLPVTSQKQPPFCCALCTFLLWDDPQQLELKKSREKKKENIHKSSKQYQ